MCIRDRPNRLTASSVRGSLEADRSHGSETQVTPPSTSLVPLPDSSSACSRVNAGSGRTFLSARLSAAASTVPNTFGALPLLSLIHISEPTRLLSISYAVFCLKKKKVILSK
eukprot:TRINITY_DN40532_c0_g1_i1.p1 TRINITY_DN40532_c0_g1~~TRINITY_DN40532_c0_g1_i1.p1  ORF type:complete len:112 (-),score=21.09 TRINITY_DN40532_c0_g1_i1:28-363(-)